MKHAQSFEFTDFSPWKEVDDMIRNCTDQKTIFFAWLCMTAYAVTAPGISQPIFSVQKGAMLTRSDIRNWLNMQMMQLELANSHPD